MIGTIWEYPPIRPYYTAPYFLGPENKTTTLPAPMTVTIHGGDNYTRDSRAITPTLEISKLLVEP